MLQGKLDTMHFLKNPTSGYCPPRRKHRENLWRPIPRGPHENILNTPNSLSWRKYLARLVETATLDRGGVDKVTIRLVREPLDDVLGRPRPRDKLYDISVPLGVVYSRKHHRKEITAISAWLGSSNAPQRWDSGRLTTRKRNGTVKSDALTLTPRLPALAHVSILSNNFLRVPKKHRGAAVGHAPGNRKGSPSKQGPRSLAQGTYCSR